MGKLTKNCLEHRRFQGVLAFVLPILSSHNSWYLSILRHITVLKTPTVCVATASPAKFSEAVKAAGIEMPLSPQLAQLLTSPTRYTEMKEGDDWDRILRNMIKDISENHSKKKIITLLS